MIVKKTITYQDLEDEAQSDVCVGYFWTTLIEELVGKICVDKQYIPQHWGYMGYGLSESEWGESDISDLASIIIDKKLKVNKEHKLVLIKCKTKSVSSVTRMFAKSILWAINDERDNSYNANFVRLIKKTLKSEFNIVLKEKASIMGNEFELLVKDLITILKSVPQNWKHDLPMTRRGTPRKNLLPIYKTADLVEPCRLMATLNPLPSSQHLWKAIESVLPLKHHTQTAQRIWVGSVGSLESLTDNKDSDSTEVSYKAESTKIPSADIGGVIRGSDTGLEANSEYEMAESVRGAKMKLREMLTGQEEAAFPIIFLNDGFSQLDDNERADALNLESSSLVKPLLEEILSKCKEISKEFNLDSNDRNYLYINLAKELF